MSDEQPVSELAGIGAADHGSPAGASDAPPPDSDAGETAEAPGRRKGSLLGEMAVLFAVALTVALLIKSFVVQPFFIPSPSMEQTLMVGDKVLVNKIVYHLRPIHRGDIVVFGGAGSWDPPASHAAPPSNLLVRAYDATLLPLFRSIAGLLGSTPGETDYIKRVIGLPGDHVACCNADGQITVNGVPLREKSYLFPRNRPSASSFSIVVPPGRLWVMGDYRDVSFDSRGHDCAYSGEPKTCQSWDRDGTIPESAVIGRAFMVIWPPGQFRILPIPATFEQKALARAAGPAAGPGRSVTAAERGLPLADGGPAGAVPVRPSAPYLPLAAGVGAALAVAALRRVRRRLRATARR